MKKVKYNKRAGTYTKVIRIIKLKHGTVILLHVDATGNLMYLAMLAYNFGWKPVDEISYNAFRYYLIAIAR